MHEKKRKKHKSNREIANKKKNKITNIHIQQSMLNVIKKENNNCHLNK